MALRSGTAAGRVPPRSQSASCAGRDRQLRGAIGTRGAHESREQRMTVARRRGELGVELRGHEPGMARQLDDLDQAILREAREPQTRARVGVQEIVVELVAVPMAFRY